MYNFKEISISQDTRYSPNFFLTSKKSPVCTEPELHKHML